MAVIRRAHTHAHHAHKHACTHTPHIMKRPNRLAFFPLLLIAVGSKIHIVALMKNMKNVPPGKARAPECTTLIDDFIGS